jgi:hypothetical protein
MKKNERAFSVPKNVTFPPAPMLEIQADLTALDETSKRLFKRAFQSIGKDVHSHVEESTLLRTVEALADHIESFRIELSEPLAADGRARVRELPTGDLSLRRVRYKRFLVCVALCRALGLCFPYDAATIRRVFPDFEPGLSDKDLEGACVNKIRGRLADGFDPIVGKRDYLHFDRQGKSYWLRLNRLEFVLKLRLWDTERLPASAKAAAHEIVDRRERRVRGERRGS